MGFELSWLTRDIIIRMNGLKRFCLHGVSRLRMCVWKNIRGMHRVNIGRMWLKRLGL